MLHTTPKQLQRAIGLPQATALVAGTIIGASIFVQPSEVVSRIPSTGGALLVWTAAGLLSLLGALVCARWARIAPAGGGVYVYLRRAFGRPVGFLWGWAMFWTMHSGIIAAIAVIFARYLGFVVELGPLGTKAAAIGAILLTSAVNLIGVRPASNLQSAFTAAKVAAILIMIIAGLAWGSPEGTAASAPPPPEAGHGAFLLALAAGLFAFGGWHMVTYSAGETIDPKRTIPLALVLGVSIVTACYLGLNLAYFRVLPYETLASSERVAADAADAVLGYGGGLILSILVTVSTLGALIGIVLAGPRVYHAMARDGLLFGWVGEIHAVYRTPHRAILIQAAWSCVLVVTGTYRALFTRVVYTEWIFFGLLALGWIRYRSRTEPPSADQSRESVWLPLAFALAAFAVAGNQIATDPWESLIGLSLVLSGLPAYWLWSARRSSTTMWPWR